MKAIAVTVALLACQGGVAMAACEPPHSVNLPLSDQLKPEAMESRYQAYLAACAKSGGELIDGQNVIYKGRIEFTQTSWPRRDEDFYDAESLRRGDSGAALVVAVIEVTGKTSNVVLIGTSGHKRLDDNAVDLIRHMRHKKPITLDGVPVRVFCSFVMQFQAQK